MLYQVVAFFLPLPATPLTMLDVAYFDQAKLRQIRWSTGTWTVGSSAECQLVLTAAGVAPRHLEISLAAHAPNQQNTAAPSLASLTELTGVPVPVSPWIEVKCLGPHCWLETGRKLHTGEVALITEPTLVFVGESHLDLLPSFQTSPRPLLSLGRSDGGGSWEHLGKAPSAVTIGGWLTGLAQLHRQAAGSAELFQLAAQLIGDPGGLDAGLVLLRSEQGWEIAAAELPRPELGLGFQPSVLETVRRTKRGWFHESQQLRAGEVHQAFRAVAAMPILDAAGEVAGAVYGTRTTHRRNRRQGIRPLEAQWLSLLAEGLSAALARVQAETERARVRVLLEQAFPPRVAQLLEHDPQIMAPKEQTITALFADLRGFTSLAARYPGQSVYQFLQEWTTGLTQCVVDQEGVVIDYYGDGLAAMWNAPTEQSDHAWRAVQAGQNMLRFARQLSEKWRHAFGRELAMGVGIHAGSALVGNAGSEKRLKYGPRGHVVNVTSRVEQACKTFDCPLLLTEAVANRLPADCQVQFLQTATLPGVSEAVGLYCLPGHGSEKSAATSTQACQTTAPCAAQSLLDSCTHLLEWNQWEGTQSPPASKLGTAQ